VWIEWRQAERERKAELQPSTPDGSPAAADVES
jgi:hypothetical protein